MSIVDGLVNKYQKRVQRLQIKFYADLGKLQIECKHEKTHWMQEICHDGSFKKGVFKRCFVCGATVETLEITDSYKEQLLGKFDAEVELKKLSLATEKVQP